MLNAHEGIRHKEETKKIRNETLSRMNQLYKKEIKAIFQKKCFDCHSGQTKFPWYFKLPVVRQWMEKDIKEGLKHLDLSNDFPFGGHGTPIEDLEAIRKTVREKTMPPLRYMLTHRHSSLTDQEEKAILEWIATSLNLILREESAH